MAPLRSLTWYLVSETLAGPSMTAPVEALKTEPWAGQVN
jgi:hypothetical protein